MGRSYGGLALVAVVCCLAAAAAAEEASFAGEKTYGSPSSGSSPLTPALGPSSGASPYVPPTPSGGSPLVPSLGPVASPYTPSGGSPLVPSLGPVASPYTPTPTTPSPATGSCSFWSSNTSLFPNFLTILTTILDIFSSGGGSGSGISSIFGSQMTLYQGLTNTRPDGYGALLRQGSAAILNSYTSRDYPYTPFQVKDAFRGALASEQSAAFMAVNFENANRGYGRRN